ncbi:MAG: Uma2 family endonuclease [Bryobacteraceae bacterium]|nr:Uma2 family endonuclease [Bryobacteraceae bacterium]
MTELLIAPEIAEYRMPVKLPYPPLTDDEFFDFCVSQPDDRRAERTAEGGVLIMANTGGETGSRNFEIVGQFREWVRRDGRGVGFDSSTLFRLPNTAMRSPDVCWVHRSRLEKLDKRQRERFLPLCPDFVIELTSPSDRLPDVQEKMAEWMANGCQLGWLIHPVSREVHVYRGDGIEILSDLAKIEAAEPVNGFVLDLGPVWEPAW